MPRGRKPRTWVKLDCEGILRGSINYLLTLEGQAVWVKMIVLSEVCGGRPGFIEDNNQQGLPHEYIAQELHCSVEVLEDVLKKMAADKAVDIDSNGSVELVNFKHYQFSEYERQKPYRDAAKKAEASLPVEIPEWIQPEAWEAYLDMRAKIKKPPTNRALVLVIKTLTELKGKGVDPNAVINQSVVHNWIDVYDLKDGQNGNNRGNSKKGFYQQPTQYTESSNE